MEDVHDHGAEVDQGPLALAQALGADGANATLAELIVDVRRDGLDVAVAGAARQDEEVGVRGVLAQIEDDDVEALALEGEVGCCAGELLCIQSAPPGSAVRDPSII